MTSDILAGSLIISLLHALLPNHWLPVMAIGRQQQWNLRQVTAVTLMAGAAHAGSTVIIGMLLAFLGWKFPTEWFNWLAPIMLIGMGIWFMYRHHTHHHFHLTNPEAHIPNIRSVILTLTLSMFLSPCLEIEAYFLLAGAQGWTTVLLLSGVYLGISVTGMVIWARLMYRGLQKFDWHKLEHSAGLITGATLVATGIASFFLH